MYSVTGPLLLLCRNRTRLLKRLVQKRTLPSLLSKISTSSIQKCKDDKISQNIFTPVSVELHTNDLGVGEELAGKLSKSDILKVINVFSRLPAVKGLAEDNGLDEKLCHKALFSFRKFCVESPSLPADLHIVLCDVKNDNAKPLDIFPYFWRHVKEMFPHLDCMDDLKKVGDIRQPANWYPEARNLERKFYFHCGPTNSGKTYNALQSFYNSESGIYCAPLKLLAVEVYNKANSKETTCDLFTGEEVIFMDSDTPSKHLSCTIEMCPLDREFDVAVIDEIQMLRDPLRGWAWTRALLGLRAKEIHLCGEEAAVDIVDSILCTTNETIEVKRYERLSELKFDEPVGSLKNVTPGDCIVCFNKNDIFTIATALESLGHNVAIVYGSLPPQTKLAQCAKFNDPSHPCKILIATDAVGMGLNLNIRRMIFYSLVKHSVPGAEGLVQEKNLISVSQALQIAGRAGRYGTHHNTGYVTTFKQKDLKTLKYLMAQRPENLDQAGLLPTIDQMELFSYYLPKSSFSELIEILEKVCTVDNSLYFMCELKDFKFLAQLIDHVPLPLRIKYLFCCAPVNRKLHFSCVMFIKFAKKYSCNETVSVQWVCEKIGWPFEKPVNVKELILLETYHEILDIYLWLNNRFEDYFPDAEIIRKIQREIDELIQQGVQNLTKFTEVEKDAEKEVELDVVKSRTEINSDV